MSINRCKVSLTTLGVSVVLICISCALFAEPSSYFPDVLLCGSQIYSAVPPDEVLAQPTPLPIPEGFSASLQKLTNLAIAPKWRPETFDDAKFLASGEGDYRAHTAHLCKTYKVSGASVTLKLFCRMFVAIFKPSPVSIGPEAQGALTEAAKYTDPCTDSSPYEEKGAPAGVVSIFKAISTEILTEAVSPNSEEYWKDQTKHISIRNGGLGYSYLAKRVDNTAGLTSDDTVAYFVTMWIDKDTLVVKLSVESGETDKGKLSGTLVSSNNVALDGLDIPYVVKMTSMSEFTNADWHLVRSQAQATHQVRHLFLQDGAEWRILVKNSNVDTGTREAAWLCLAASRLGTMVEGRYDYRMVNCEGSPSAVLDRLDRRRQRCLEGFTELEQAKFPDSLTSFRQSLLGVLGNANVMWDIAWPQWKEALSAPNVSSVDYKAVIDAVNKTLRKKKMPEFWDWGEVWKIIERAQTELGIKTIGP